MTINFISFKDFRNQIIYLKIDNTEIMMGSETDEINEELFQSLLERYQELVEESKNESDVVFDSVDALSYNLNKISLSRDESHMDSPKWLKNKKATINPKNDDDDDDKCFQDALTVA